MPSTPTSADSQVLELCKNAVAEVEVSRITIKKLREYLVLADEQMARYEKQIESYQDIVASYESYIKTTKERESIREEQAAEIEKLIKNLNSQIENATKNRSAWSKVKDALLVILAAATLLK